MFELTLHKYCNIILTELIHKNGALNLKILKNKKIIICITSVTLAITLIIGACALYVSDYYRADTDAIEAFAMQNDATKTVLNNGAVAYGDVNAIAGFIFYPGGKVEFTAYEPLMRNLATKGILCIMVEMPFNLAVLDINAADGIREHFPKVKDWYIGGHSLGGSMAASYLSKHTDDFCGLVLLGSYSTADLSKASISALSIFGSEDKVMNMDKYEKYRKNLPADFSETKIEGGCHAYFGMYGRQDGDGTPTINAEEQIIISSGHISEFILKAKK